MTHLITNNDFHPFSYVYKMKVEFPATTTCFVQSHIMFRPHGGDAIIRQHTTGQNNKNIEKINNASLVCFNPGLISVQPFSPPIDSLCICLHWANISRLELSAARHGLSTIYSYVHGRKSINVKPFTNILTYIFKFWQFKFHHPYKKRLLAREGVYAPGRPVFLVHTMQKVSYIVGLEAIRLAFFMRYE